MKFVIKTSLYYYARSEKQRIVQISVKKFECSCSSASNTNYVKGVGTFRRIAADFMCTASFDDHKCNRFLSATT
jgi:hypothetical protein